MRDSITAYLEYCAALRYSDATIASYNNRLKLFRLFALTQKIHHIRDITLTLVRRFHDHLLEKHLSSSTMECYLTTLRAYLQWCHRHRLILSDFTAKIELPKKSFTLPPQPLTENDIAKLFLLFAKPGILNLRNLAMLEIFYACGLRRQEVIDLNVEDVDFQRGVVHVRGKGDKERLVPIHERALKAISAYLVARGGKPGRKSPLLLTHSTNSKGSTRMTGIGVQKVFAKLSKRFPKHVHPHLFRHTFALHLLQNGVDIRYVQLLLGHESPDTSSRYLGYCKEEIKREYDRGIEWILLQE